MCHRIAVVARNNGARHLYTFEPGAEAAGSALQLDEDQARALGAILAGVHFRPVEANHDAPVVFGGVAIDWLTVESEAPMFSVHDLVPADHPTTSLIAIGRGEDTIVKPGPAEQVHPGDQLMIAGNRADISRVRDQVTETALN